jgi:DNA polymerase III epsilon subunit-like protein
MALKALFFDTETTDKVVHGVYPLCIQLGWALDKAAIQTRLVRIDAPIAPGARAIHGISDKILQEKGEEPMDVFSSFLDDVRLCTHIVAHNAEFDRNVVLRTLRYAGADDTDIQAFLAVPVLCTMRTLTPVTQIPHLTSRSKPKRASTRRKSFKWPRLQEAAEFFGLPFERDEAHDAGYDVAVLRSVYFALMKAPQKHLCKVRAQIRRAVAN